MTSIGARTMDHENDEFAEERPSKSQVKREMQHLQALGEQLTRLPADALDAFPVGNDLRAAIAEHRRLKGREALRRHLQYIGRLMRGEDAAAIEQALEAARSGGMEEKRRLHLTEQWRDRLLQQGDDALADFLGEHPGADRQHLRQLLRSAAQEQARGKPPAAARKLFKYLREVLFGGQGG
jgi:ribosome-associated protein